MRLSIAKMKICFALLTLLTFVACQRIECDFNRQFLCGDQCLSNGLPCHCGNDTLTLKDSWNYYCCHQPNTCHVSNKTYWGDIQCQGQKKWWNKLCDGSCRQNAKYGYTMLPCKDQSVCYMGISACRGKPKCKE